MSQDAAQQLLTSLNARRAFLKKDCPPLKEGEVGVIESMEVTPRFYPRVAIRFSGDFMATFEGPMVHEYLELLEEEHA